MTTREYLQKIQARQKYRDVTFIIARAVKDENTPFYHYEFRNTPLRKAEKWLQAEEEFLDEQLVINADHAPIDVTGLWGGLYKRGSISCAMLTTEADLRLLYSEEQAARMAAHYKKTVTI